MALVKRERRTAESVQEWLLSDEQRKWTKFGLEGASVRVDDPCWPFRVEPNPFDARQVPRIPGYLDGFVETSWASPAPPIKINAPMPFVWDRILDFDRYYEWNPFQRQVVIVQNADGNRYARLYVNFRASEEDKELLPVEKTSQVGKERILYVDERPTHCILIYGLDGKFMPTLRVQVVEKVDESSCMYYSYDGFGGLMLSVIIRPLAQQRFVKLFTLASKALKNHCEKRFAEMHNPKL